MTLLHVAKTIEVFHPRSHHGSSGEGNRFEYHISDFEEKHRHRGVTQAKRINKNERQTRS